MIMIVEGLAANGATSNRSNQTLLFTNIYFSRYLYLRQQGRTPVNYEKGDPRISIETKM